MSEVPGSDRCCPQTSCLSRWDSYRRYRRCSRRSAWKGTARNAKAETDGKAATHVGSQGLAAGDMRRGQSLVVWAIREGRQCARFGG